MKKTNTKKALGMSLISLLACGVMFAGSTYAWFTDEVVASGNRIESGTLKADMEVLKDDEWVSLKEKPETKIFDYDKWEPGYSAFTTLRILNKGNLGFRYQVLGEFAGQTYGPNGESLADVIDVYMYAADITDPFEIPTMTDFASIKAEAEANASNTRAEGWYKVGTLDFWMNLPYGLTAGYMLPEGAEYDGTMYGYNGVCETGYPATVVLHMQEEAGNEYQGLTLGDINLTLKATQWAWEKDGFGNSNYDDAATIKNEAQLIAALKKGGTIELGAPVALDEVVEISADTVINLNGYDLDTSACARRPFQMANGADLTINATNSEIKAGNYGLVYIPDGESKVVLNGGSYTSNMDNGSFIKPKGTAKVEVELNNVKFADASDDSYIMDASSYGGNELVVTINGGDYSCAKGINGHNADFTVKGATIETSLFSFEAGAGSTLLIEDSEISVLTNTENPAAPSACVALSDTTGTNPSSATVKNSVLNSKYHVFANYSGHNTLTYTDCEINHSGDAAQLMIYDNPVGSSLVVNGMEAASVETPSALAAALADTSVDYIALSSDVALTEQLNIAADREVVLDLAGCDVTASVGVQATSALINNKGALTITGEGHVGYTSTTPSEGYWYSTSTIVNSGKLTINGGSFINYTSGGASYVIDNAPGAELEINDGYFYNKGIVLRAYSMNGSAANNVVINGGEFVSEASRVLQAHLISSTNGSAPVVNFEITGVEHMGGIVGNGYYANFSNCSVLANEGSSITATGYSFVGGIVGYHGEGALKIEDCDVKNLELTAYGAVGAITGIAQYSNIITGCTAENVVLNKTGIASLASVGLACGTWTTKAGRNTLITDNSFKNITLNGKYIPASGQVDILFGSNYSNVSTNNEGTFDNNVYENIVNNLELAAASGVNTSAAFVSALTDDSIEEIELKDDIVLTEDLTIAADREVTIHLNGKTLDVTSSATTTSALLINKGELVIEGKGNVVYESSKPSASYGYSTSTIVNSGKLTINGGNFINETIGGASYVIDNAPGAELTINDGYFYNNGITIRAYSMDGYAANNVVINGGEFVSEGSRVLQSHLISSTNNKTAPVVNITINGGTFTTNDEEYSIALYSYSVGTSMANVTFTLNGGTYNGDIALDGGAGKNYGQTVIVFDQDACTFNGYVYRYITADPGYVDLI